MRRWCAKRSEEGAERGGAIARENHGEGAQRSRSELLREAVTLWTHFLPCHTRRSKDPYFST